MYRCECWAIKKPECQRIDAFRLWCWRKHLRVPWTAKRSNQSILKEISPEYSLEGLMLKLKFQYFGQLMQRADSLEKILILGKIEGRRRRGPERTRFLEDKSASLTPWTWVWASSRRWWRTGKPVCYSPWGHKEWDPTGRVNSSNKRDTAMNLEKNTFQWWAVFFDQIHQILHGEEFGLWSQAVSSSSFTL